MRKTYGDVDSKFKFVIVASKRAKQLLKGAKPKIKSRSKSPIRIAQEEVKDGLVDYEIVQKKKEEAYKPDDEDFIGEEIIKEAEASEEAKMSKKEAKPEKEGKKKEGAEREKEDKGKK